LAAAFTDDTDQKLRIRVIRFIRGRILSGIFTVAIAARPNYRGSSVLSGETPVTRDATMNLLRYFLSTSAALALCLAASTASADCGGYGIGNCSFGNLNAFGASGSLYGSGYLPVPPYFAIHPPVYYSHQYYRPYGWSPFAQPGYIAPAMLRPEPRLVVNPHVKDVKVKMAPKDNTARSEMIVNPYFVKAGTTGQGLVTAEK
jgi:hypothetical protein